MKNAFYLVTLFFFTACVNDRVKSNQNNPHDLTAKVIYLKDGDSFVVLDHRQKEIEVRLLEIDAPELHQPFGKKAKTYLSNLIKGKTVRIDYEEKDAYGRILADVYLDTLFVNEQLLREGWAWHFTLFSTDEAFAAFESQARTAQKGLWQDANPIPPWVWRKRGREKLEP